MPPAELLVNLTAGALAGGGQMALFNPLDCLRIRWQLARRGDGGGNGMATSTEFALAIVRREGWWAGLHRPGLLLNMGAISVSQGLRIGLYPTVRERLTARQPAEAAAPLVMFGAGLLCGSIGYFVAAPLILLKVRAHAAAQLRGSGGAPPALVVPSSLAGFWLGSSPMVVRGALLTAGQMAGYDGAKRVGRARGVSDGPGLHVLAAVVAGLSAATVSAPADMVQTRMQSAAQEVCTARVALTARDGLADAPPLGPAPGMLAAVRLIAEEGGASAFFRGWSLSVLRLIPTFIVGSTIFEQVRRTMGLSYMR